MMVVLEKLCRRFGPDVIALDGLDLQIAEGETYGLLGTNGAGKTTTMRILATLLAPTQGRAMIAGYNVLSDAAAVRRLIGFSMQDPALAPYATIAEQLTLMARLHGLSRAQSAQRIEQLAAALDMAAWLGRQARTLSGGMRRRADLACALLSQPRLLLLDEPSAGLDIAARASLWRHIAQLRREGTTIVLCTHHLEEAERLCDRIGIVHAGRLLADGTPADLKARHGAPAIRLTIANADLAAARAALEPIAQLRICGAPQSSHAAQSSVAAQLSDIKQTAEMKQRRDNTFAGETSLLSEVTLAIEAAAPLPAMASVASALAKARISARKLQLSEPALEDVLARLLGIGEGA